MSNYNKKEKLILTLSWTLWIVSSGILQPNFLQAQIIKKYQDGDSVNVRIIPFTPDQEPHSKIHCQLHEDENLKAQQTHLNIGIHDKEIALYGGGVKLYEPFTSQNRNQYRDLGISPYDLIPSEQSAITSLAVSSDGEIYGGTTGETANLFVFSPGYNFGFPLGIIPGQESIYHSLVFDNKDFLYVGTNKNIYKQYHIDNSVAIGRNSAYRLITNQIKTDYINYDGGRIYRLNTDSVHIIPKQTCSDLFKFVIISRSTFIITKTVSQIPLGDEIPYISRVLVQDKKGNIYCNTYGGYLLKFDPVSSSLDTLEIRLPGMKGRWVFNALECAVLHSSGIIYGGTPDGYFFGFNPEIIYNYGKPLMESKIRTVTQGNDGNIYGIGGENHIGMSRLFKFITRNHTFTDLGMIQVSHVPYQEYTGYIFDCMVTGKEGTLYMGQTEYRGKLFLYNP